MAVDTQLLADLQQRGLIAQVSDLDALNQRLQQPTALYCGFDPTAPSLHIGSLVPILMLRRFQLAGHQPIALVGGSTGLIGDPSFKAEERKLIDTTTLQSWVAKLKGQLEQFLDFDGESPAIMTNNYDWTAPISSLEFLRDFGKYFSVNAMMRREAVKTRLEREDQGISYTEFSYVILQALDFYYLHKLHNCELQLGGSDQWGNIVAGMDLIRKKSNQTAYCLTTPLITQADGTKFGKTEKGTIWLSADKTSPFSFYQFWLRVLDTDIYRFLRYFTFLSCDKIAEIERADSTCSGAPEGSQILAREVTKLVHGSQALEAATRISHNIFKGDIKALQQSDWQQLQLDGIPSTPIAPQKLDGQSLTSLLTESQVVKSGKQAKDALNANSITINQTVVKPSQNMQLPQIFAQQTAFFGRYWLVRVGKKKVHLFYS